MSDSTQTNLYRSLLIGAIGVIGYFVVKWDRKIDHVYEFALRHETVQASVVIHEKDIRELQNKDRWLEVKLEQLGVSLQEIRQQQSFIQSQRSTTQVN